MVSKQKNESLRQQYQRLTQNRARARASGQPTPKLDAKIERLRTLMNSNVTPPKPAKPSPSKYMNYTGVNKRPMQGGKVSPR